MIKCLITHMKRFLLESNKMRIKYCPDFLCFILFSTFNYTSLPDSTDKSKNFTEKNTGAAGINLNTSSTSESRVFLFLSVEPHSDIK